MQDFANILVFVGTKDPTAALKRAWVIARENDAQITFMDVVKPVPSTISAVTRVATPHELTHLLVEERERTLRQLVEDYAENNETFEIVVATGDSARKICKQVIKKKHDLVLKTADGFSLAGHLFSSVARTLMRACPCPVWVLKPQIHGAFDQVLAAIDLDADDDPHKRLNDSILKHAYSIAERDQATLHIVSAWDLWMEQALRRRAGDEEIDAALKKRAAIYQDAINDLLDVYDWDGKDIQVHIHRGVPSTVIRRVADQVEADLVVMGTVCRTGVAGVLIGNTAENLLSSLTCSVLSFKPNGFESPVELD